MKQFRSGQWPEHHSFSHFLFSHPTQDTYFAASRVISVWISPDFEPVFQAAFNLVVLLLAATGIIVFARRRR